MNTYYRTYNDVPKQLWKRHVRGSSLVLLEKLMDELTGAKRIFISFFLYNNPFLHKFLEDMSEQGCEIYIYSIPLDGYDAAVKQLYKRDYSEENSVNFSKFDYAQRTYNRISNNNQNISLKIFPHTYIWYKVKFNRGKNLFSLHNKSIMAEFENSVKCISSSCNFAFGDPPHSDSFIVIEGKNTDAEKMFKKYFSILDKLSYSINEYIDFRKTYYDFDYIVNPVNLEDTYSLDYFTAPFIKYNGIGSNHYVQEQIIKFIKSAQNQIYICAQHINDIESFDENAASIVQCLIDMDKNVVIKVLKQTRPENQKQGDRTVSTEEALKKCSNVSQKYWTPTIHDKFIIVDDKKMLFTTANFTPTAFAWEENHLMSYEVVRKDGRKETVKRRNTFSEVNSFHFIEDKNLVEKYIKHFENLWNKSAFIE
ncbi:phospholipase D-like domain-containing protein [Bacillus benzoevorans]|uniref:Phosphatidylserine/phosphatidylglycerophosphate/ cardiolipin synthase-like enzyme n=1 Tax=Bacillus benzoevorans TaxID=1456 RepID=A0A7X0LVA9_9BACI|nr:phospholipase D-like domain-containing protein [Bacillus benzoevorans]MBB6445796.1 phosphatidylserine/phosphatidylglycerophosphate/cardiolipin synthase-like enzyme [Bacillus benzoevorans]